MTGRPARFAAATVVALGAACAHGDETGKLARPTFGGPPRVAIAADELAALKAGPDFDVQRDAAIKAAQPHLDQPVTVPDGHGGWIFDYACRDDGTTLRPVTPAEHECPKCQKRYTGAREVVAYRCRLHHDLERAAYRLAWAWALSGDERFAAEVRRVLLKLADDYAGYPARRDRWGRNGWLAPLGGRRYVQSLDEAVGVIELARAYDLTRSAEVWTEAERQHVEKDFFRATANSLLRFSQPHNHQTWYNAGLVTIASVLGDGDLLLRVLEMPRGVLHQLEHNVGADGLWNEGAMAYHNFALQPLIQTADMTRRLGMKLHEHPKLRAMIVAPLHAAYPNGQFPAINDSDPGSVRMFDWAFVWARKTYGVSIQTNLPTVSEALTDAGLAVLRMGDGADAACALLDYGPHGGGHGHFDKLNLMLYANGREWLLDPGRLTYSHKEYKTWVKTTAAHNTVAIHGQNQAATTGKLLWLAHTNDWAACAAESDGAYDGVRLRRFLLLTSSFLVDVFDVQADRARQLDWFAHALSDKLTPVGGLAGQPSSPGNANGYQHLSDGVAYSARGPSQWDFVAGDRTLRLWLDGAKSEQVFAARGIGYSVEQRVPCLIRRRAARETRFVAVYDLSGRGGAVRGVGAEHNPRREPRVKVETAERTWTVQFTHERPVVARAEPGGSRTGANRQ